MSVLICTPMYGNQCTAVYHKSLLRVVQAFERESYPYDVMIGLNESLIDRARNNMAWDFLQTDYKKLLFIDADIEFDPDDVAKLLAPNLPIMSGVYAMKKPDAQWYAAWVNGELVKDLDQFDDLIEADYTGTGFLCIDREVLETLMVENPDLENDDPTEKWGFFNRMKVDGVMLSEDYAFCHRAKESGFKINVDPSVRLVHHGMYPYGKS